MTDHATEAKKLAQEVAKTDPGAAAVVHACLALAEANGPSEWTVLHSYEDLPEQTGVTYIFEYQDGSHYAWQYIVLENSSMLAFRDAGQKSGWKDPNELVDECVRWRYS